VTDVLDPSLCVHHLFERQVARTPDAVAVVFGDRALTYRELDARAERLAGLLRRLGVGPIQLVGLCVERSLEMAVGLLAILKAGGAYVPLDPAYPRERLAWIIDDTRAPVLLTQRSLAGVIPTQAATVVFLDDDEPGAELGPLPDEHGGRPVHAEHLAYVIYTSGSTGRPKGICLPHRALVNLIQWHDRTLLRAARTLQFASLSFDASFHEMFAAWSSGGTVYLITEAIRRDVAALVRFIADHAIEKVILPVVIVQQMAEHYGDQPERFRSLRELTTTGEQLHVTAPIVRLFEQLPGCKFHNHYGPSETHVVTAYTLPDDPRTWPSHPPIGHAIDHTSLFVLDEQGAPVADGEPGELYIGGVMLAQGYLRRPDLTAERFVYRDGARLYRTGDLVRWRHGELEFLGRLDHQVKIRGFRVELGEIEGTLTQHPHVDEAVVLAREDRPGERRLVAYVVAARGATAAAPGEAPLTARLRTHLQERLPDYMVPAAFVVVDAMPLTANGKVDRRALPAPGTARPELAQAYVAPRNPLEATIAEIWEQALGLDQVGVLDDFFALGGDSLCAVQVFARVRQRLGVEVSFAALFTHPTIELFAGCVADAAATRTAPLEPRSRAGLLPPSFAQERVWFLHQLATNRAVYDCAYAFRVDGPLDRLALEASLRELTRRHEILRTTFPEVRGEPFQQINDDLDLRLDVRDLRDLAAADQPAALHELLTAAVGHEFDLARGPLLRAGLIQLADAAHVFWLNLHHIVTDGRSMEVLFRELAALYGEATAGTPARLAPQPLQYADYAGWQREVLSPDVVDELVGWWRDQLAGTPALLALPTDRRRPPVQSFRGGAVPLVLDRELTDALRGLGAAHGTTLTMTVLAGFAALLHRYSGQDELVIGVPSLGRDRVETENLVGFFVNTLPVRLRFDGAPTFEGLLAQVRQTCLDAFEHDALPFERIVQELRLERSASHNPLVQVAIAPQPPGERDLRLPGLTVAHLDVETRRAVCDLTLYCWDSRDGLTATIEYAADLFDHATIERLAGHLRNLLAGAVAAPTTGVARLPMLSDGERHQLLVEWNQTARPVALDRCYHELVADQAARTPDALAVIEPSGRALTYAALDARANQLGHHLRGLGVGPDDLVALCTERSVDLLVGILGIMKAGGAYLPLDPTYPRDRLAWMITDGAPRALVTQAHLEGLLPAPEHVVRLDTDWGTIAREPTTAPARVTGPEHLAYVIYTSGSTGAPKGVMIEHRNLLNVVEVQRLYLGLTAEARVLQFSSPCFDASVWELATALTVGATVCLLPPGPALLGPELGRLIRDQRVTTANLVPSVIRDIPVELVPDLRTIVAAGEACPEELVAIWSPGRRFINGYGPTECTVCVSLADTQPSGAPPPIGRPQANIRAYVLDRDEQPVPIGVAGELYVGGAGVARGYLHRPDLTEQRFVPDRFEPGPGRRLYRTGDIVRWRADGELEFIGRRDAQVKVRGFRIELGEIEAAIRAHADVHDVAVVVREDVPGDRRLAAYVVAGGDAAAAPAEAIDAHLSTWQALYDSVFDGAHAEDAGADFTGWNSSYTGKPLPADEMRAWRDRTIERILALGAQRVWEIGCGTGLLLLPVAPRCAEYLGTDLSQTELTLLAAEVQRRGLTGVTLERRRADDFTGIAPGRFDAVIVNSVAQYFPDLRYLRAVIRGALAAVRPGGSIFLGDIRSLPLLPAFRATVEAARATTDLPAATLRRNVDRAVATEQELVIDPELFHALRAEHPEIAAVEIQLKRGRHDNELEAYRYDVVLHVGGAGGPAIAPATAASERRGFTAIGADVAAIERWLVTTGVDAAELVAVPDARVRPGLDLLTLVAEAPAPALHPEDLWELGDRLGYHVRIAPSREGGAGRFDVRFDRVAAAAAAPWCPPAAGSVAPPEALVNDPLRQSRERALPGRLRTFLEGKLPGYMVPADIVVLDALPLTPAGKLDRQALPAPDSAPAQTTREYVAPRDQLEEDLARLWSELLGVPRVGVHDDFFDLGGHSMMVAWLVVRIEDRLGLDLPMRALYEAPTIAQLARLIEDDRRTPGVASLCYTPSLRLEDECRLDDAVVAGAPPVDLTRPAEQVLLTGATGFVGSFLLAELLATTSARVSCLVRGRNAAEARARLRRSFTSYGLPLDGLDSRVDVVIGDLGTPRLGLAAADYDALADSVDSILHNGAKVDHVRGYLDMKPANVIGTGEVLKLATHRRLKPVHLISTLGTVYPPTYTAEGVVREDAPAGPLGQLPNGYMQSKCIAEGLVVAAIARGVPAAIYRLGAVTGHSQTGICNPGDFTYSALRTTLDLGFADDMNTDLTITPVDFAVRAIVALTRWSGAPGQVFHVTHPRPWFWLDMVASLRERGYAIQTMPYAECMAGLFEIARRGVDTPMLSFLSFITQRVPGSSRYVAEDYYAPVRWDCEHTLAGLTAMGVDGPPAAEQLLDTYLDYLTRRQLLTSPRT